MSDETGEYENDYPAIRECAEPLLIEGELGPPCCDRCGGLVRLPLENGE